ncbi:BgTH12-04367 [Blumeria graminis f. sp. triticale]|uniref:BgTH12-04367 n=1 Tax=Blumeria graminis f. sp. triticale TaxID=1689686 RepID=A0A9W4CUK6_BLUGR|nr:BgTH12-04367 [Blumeria graminis f. sp. triticale]
MAFSRFLIKTVLALCIACTATGTSTVLDQSQTPQAEFDLSVSITTSFPSSELFGVQIFNGLKTVALLDLMNNEADKITLKMVKGSLSNIQRDPKVSKAGTDISRNLTSARYDVAIPAGQNQSIPFTFTTDLLPQDFNLSLIAIVINDEGKEYQVPAYNGTVSVVDPATSILDPKVMFLNLFFTIFSGLILYWVYKHWIEHLIPVTKRGGKGMDRFKRSTQAPKAEAISEKLLSTISNAKSVDLPNTSAWKSYDESWIPDHHIKKPTPKRSKNGLSKK